MSRPLVVSSPEKLKIYIDRFISLCEAGKAEPTDWQLCKFLGISAQTLKRYYAGGEKETDLYFAYNYPIEDLIKYREDRLLKKLEASRNATPYMFQLKQAKNGGYTDSPIANDNQGGTTITLKIDGVGGESAFK